MREAAIAESVRPEVAFCLWALRRDGLKASPFDQHSDGDGQLRAAGLDADSWKRWLRAVVGAQEHFAQGIGDGSASKDSLGLRRLGRAAADPVRFAPPKVRRVLRDWWLEYRDEGAAWRRSARPGLIASLDRSDQRAFVARLDELGGLQIYLAPYLVTAALSVAPETIVLGIPRVDRANASSAREAIMEAAQRVHGT